MSKKNNTIVRFPSGRSIKRLKQDAKSLAKQKGIPLSLALDEIAKLNGGGQSWAKAMHGVRSQENKQANGVSQRTLQIHLGEPVKTDMNPYRKLLVLGLNEVLSRNYFSLNWDGQSRVTPSHIVTTIAGENTVVAWDDASFGEVRVSVWWKYNHDAHPQANLEGAYRESFQTSAPLAKRQHYKKFVGVTCSAWLERDTGKYLQGKDKGHIFDRYARRGELELLKKIPNPVPLGFAPDGPFHM